MCGRSTGSTGATRVERIASPGSSRNAASRRRSPPDGRRRSLCLLIRRRSNSRDGIGRSQVPHASPKVDIRVRRLARIEKFENVSVKTYVYSRVNTLVFRKCCVEVRNDNRGDWRKGWGQVPGCGVRVRHPDCTIQAAVDCVSGASCSASCFVVTPGVR